MAGISHLLYASLDAVPRFPDGRASGQVVKYFENGYPFKQ